MSEVKGIHGILQYYQLWFLFYPASVVKIIWMSFCIHVHVHLGFHKSHKMTYDAVFAKHTTVIQPSFPFILSFSCKNGY